MKLEEFDEEDWGLVSEQFDVLQKQVGELDLAAANEAQTRYDIIDELIRKVLCWRQGHVSIEEVSRGPEKAKYVDYILRVADTTIVIEAKRSGAAFPSPTSKLALKLSGSILGKGEISKAIKQAEKYGIEKGADVVCVTNGSCWCFYSTHEVDINSKATLLFPFAIHGHAEKLFQTMSEQAVRKGSIQSLLDDKPIKPDDRLLSIIHDADGRLNRNTIADYIIPALNDAFYADALLSNPESLRRCFVSTEGRLKFDSMLEMHLGDPKPSLVMPAPRIKKSKQNGPLERLIGAKIIDHAPPVTLILGSVGSGKTTYLKHFELVSGSNLLKKQQAHWIYIDFEEMGQAGEPRDFIYKKLKEYLLKIHSEYKDNYKYLVEPAYAEEIEAMRSGPLARISGDEAEFNRRITDLIQDEYVKTEPYVDRLFKYLASTHLCAIIMDNVDLFEDESLETRVFAEGLALSKRLYIHVIVSLRDRTFVKHRNTPTFNASELQKLWLDPPPFKQVLSNRLAYSRSILKGKHVKLPSEKGIKLDIPDLSIFFDIVQRSVLSSAAGDYIESMADLSIRQGLQLVKNFLTSGHIQADWALKNYLSGNTTYYFPFHEVFKVTVLAQYKYFKESRADCINVFDSRRGVRRIRLLRLTILSHLASKAQNENTIEVGVKECIKLFEQCGATKADIVESLSFLHDNALIRTVTAYSVSEKERVVITRSGGYYLKRLSHTFVYVEQCMLDTAIDDFAVWEKMRRLTVQIETEKSSKDRMILRRDRVTIFMKYLQETENLMLGDSPGRVHLKSIRAITVDVTKDADSAVSKASMTEVRKKLASA